MEEGGEEDIYMSADEFSDEDASDLVVLLGSESGGQAVVTQTDSQTCYNSSDDGHNSDGRSLTTSDEVWVVPLLVVSTITLAMTTIYLMWVFSKTTTRTSPSRRHLFLSQVLLLGLLLGSALGIPYSLSPGPATCLAIRLGTGLSLATIYSALLVKQVFLISLHTGVYLPAMYQALLLSFCLMVQLGLGLQWVSLVPGCRVSPTQHTASLGYVLFLVVLVSLLSVKSRHLKENYRESSFIFLLMVIKLPLWVTWFVFSVTLPHTYQHASQGFALVTTCLVTFLVMFLPRSRRLTALGKEGLYLEDQEDEQLCPHQGGRISRQASSAAVRRQDVMPGQEEAGSYLGFHRPMGVVPPTSTPPLFHLSPPPCPPPGYRSQFPSHFYPDKLYQYWHHYHPRIPETYKRLENELLNSYFYPPSIPGPGAKSPKQEGVIYKSTSLGKNGYSYL